MNKRGTKILIGCILCTMIVLLLFLIVFKFSQLSCELVSLDPIQLSNSQMVAFSRDSKPIRSHDETILMKFSAYLEYNIQSDANGSGSTPKGAHDSEWPNQATPTRGTNFSATNSTLASQQPATTANGNNKNSPPPVGRYSQGPMPSTPQLGLAANQQQSNLSVESPPQGAASLNRFDSTGFGAGQQQQHSKAEKRFMPLELKSIETRSNDGPKHKYILNFNCTRIIMVMVHQNSRVYVESMSLELKPSSRQETTCEVQLPSTGVFMVADSTGLAQSLQQVQSSSAGSIGQSANGSGQVIQQENQTPGASNSNAPATNATIASNKSNNAGLSKEYPHFAHYYCNRPLRYSCYHYNSKSGPSQSNGILLAELHINGIEFETSTSWHGKHKKVKSEFKSKRSECNI